MGTEIQKNQHKNTQPLLTINIAADNKLYFVSHPIYLCLLPVSMKLWQANMGTYR